MLCAAAPGRPRDGAFLSTNFPTDRCQTSRPYIRILIVSRAVASPVISAEADGPVKPTHVRGSNLQRLFHRSAS